MSYEIMFGYQLLQNFEFGKIRIGYNKMKIFEKSD